MQFINDLSLFVWEAPTLFLGSMAFLIVVSSFCLGALFVILNMGGNNNYEN